MPSSSGTTILLRLLESLVRIGGSARHAGASPAAGHNLADLLLSPLNGNMSPAGTEPSISSLWPLSGTGITSPTPSLLSTLLTAQPRNSTPVLSYLSSGLLGGFLGSLIAPDAADAQSPRAPFVLPASIALEAGIGPSASPTALDYGQDGTPRTMPTLGQPVTSSVVVNVQAMDSRSFLDRRDDIASAVREALLNSHPLGDYLAE